MKIVNKIKELIHEFKLAWSPERKIDFWYNYAVHCSDANYTCFDKNKEYIKLKVGLHINIFEDGINKVFEVESIGYERGSDWLYQSDALNCNLIRIK